MFDTEPCSARKQLTDTVTLLCASENKKHPTEHHAEWPDDPTVVVYWNDRFRKLVEDGSIRVQG